GAMDYFYVGNHIKSVGLHDGYASYSYKKNKFSLRADLHYFASTGNISAGTDKYLGTELDLSFGYKVNEAALLSAGWSSMFASDNMEVLKGAPNSSGSNWAWLMLTVKPDFIK
ncbi:MAG: hypothetical protein ACK5HT_20940, partial [Draconibacterium sp.]